MQTIFVRLFRHDGLTRAKLLDGYSNDYVPFDGNVYDTATGRNCIDTIARHAGKLHPKHIIRRDGNIVKNADDKLQYILSIRPNPLMTTSEFIEKIVAQYYCYNNLFVYIQRNQNGDITALWPLNFNNLELFEDRQGNLYCQFTFGSGEQATVPYEELIHIRRHYNRDEVLVIGGADSHGRYQPTEIRQDCHYQCGQEFQQAPWCHSVDWHGPPGGPGGHVAEIC